MCHLPISGVLPPNLDLSPVTHLSSFKKPNIVKKNIPEQACNPQSWTSQNCGFPTKWKIYDETFPAYRYDCLERELSIQEWSCLHLQKVGKKKWQKLCIDNLKYQVFFQFTTSLELDLDEIVQNLCEANIEKPFVPLLPLCRYFWSNMVAQWTPIPGFRKLLWDKFLRRFSFTAHIFIHCYHITMV